MRWGGLLFVGFLFWGGVASARVFKMGDESFATYLRGQYGLAQQGDTPFADSSGNDVAFDSTYTSNLAYEFGFVYATRYLNLRFGFEVIKPADLKDIKGTSADGTELYVFDNNISAYAPKIGIEFNLRQRSHSRFFLNADFGLATVTVQNSYVFTAAGANEFSGMTDFREELKGTGSLIETAVGYETHLSDTTTLVLDVGYRTLQIESLTHNLDVVSFQGPVSKGATATDMDGNDRTLNLSGGFASLMLRIWIK